MDSREIEKAIEKADVISFDVFDTLLFRITARPEMIFDLISQKINMPEFCKLRQESQKTVSRNLCRSKVAPHANLDQIYEYIAKNNPDIDWEGIKKLEIDIETDAVFANREIYKIYEYALLKGKRIIAVSDMYFNESQIHSMLEKNGYSEIDHVYSSADLKKTKYEKTIFARVAEIEGVNGQDILHIGDNKKDDVDNARFCGWNAIWYQGPQKGGSCIDIFAGIAQKKNAESDFWARLGADVAGNLYVHLYLWLKKLKGKYECNSICFLARDGYNMWNICKNQNETDITYLEMSRRSLMLAGITRIDKESLDLLPPYSLGQTLEEILNYLRIDPLKLELHQAGFRSVNDVIRTKEDQKRVKQLFQINEQEILKVCGIEREAAVKYFTSKKIFGKKILFFDCGWNGSSQYLLQRFYHATGNTEEIRFAYVGILDNKKSAFQLRDSKFDTYLFGPGKNQKISQKISKSIVIPELFFGAPYPSVWYYENGKVVYENEEFQTYRQKICEGIMEYFQTVYPFVEKYHIIFEKSTILNSIFRLTERPTAEEAVKIGNLENVDGFARQRTQKKYIAFLDFKTIVKAPRIEIYWQSGLLKRKDVSLGVKIFVIVKNSLKYAVKSVKKV